MYDVVVLQSCAVHKMLCEVLYSRIFNKYTMKLHGIKFLPEKAVC